MKPFLPTRAAEIIYALMLFVFGFNHMHAGPIMSGGVPVPGGVFWVYFTGAAFILAAVAIILNRFKTIACYLLALMLLLFVILIHVPAFVHGQNQMAKMMPMVSILKDTALAMGAILIGNNVYARREVTTHKQVV